MQQRLRFLDTGPGQNPLVIAGHLDGEGYAGANFREILYLLNVSPQAQTLALEEEAGKTYVLHPVQRASTATDLRPAAQARIDARHGRFTVPARTVVVYVIEQ